MNFRITYIAIVFLLSFNLSAQQKVWDWMEQIGGTEWDVANGFDIDSKDNIYIAGSYNKNIRSNGKLVKSENDSKDIFIGRFTSKGKLKWLLGFGGEGFDKVTKIKASADNDLYTCGFIEGKFKYGKTKVEIDGKALFVSKVNKKGKAAWINTFSYSNVASMHLLDIKADNKLVLSGTFTDTITIGNKVLISNACTNAFIVQCTEEGDIEKVKHFKSAKDIDVTSLSADSTGTIYLAGKFASPIYVDDDIVKGLEECNENSCFIMRLNESLTPVHTKSITSNSYLKFDDIVNTSEGKVFISGNFKNDLICDSLVYPSKGSSDFFIGQIDSLLNWKWVKTFGSKYADHIQGVKANKLGGLMMFGSIGDTLKMDSLQINSLSGCQTAIIVQTDSLGQATWGESIGSSGSNTTLGSSLDSKGNLYMMGSFTEQLSANETQFESFGDEDIFLAKYFNCPPVSNIINQLDVLCEDSVTVLSVGKDYSNVVWNDTIKNTNSFTVDKPGLYTVQLVDKKGCLIRDSLRMDQVQKPDFSLGNDTLLFQNETLLLNGPNDMHAYLWQDGSSSQMFEALCDTDAPAKINYFLNYTDMAGCQWNDDINIRFIPQSSLESSTGDDNDIINIYPIPVKSILFWRLDINTTSNFDVEIIDINGSVLLKRRYKFYAPYTEQSIDVSGLAAGVYYLSFTTSNKKVTQSFIVK